MTEIRQARLEDYPAIAAFIEAAYGELAPYKGEARWRWQFPDNPHNPFPPGLAPVWIAIDEGRVVGQIGVQFGPLDLGGEIRPAGWIVDVMVLPEYRSQGLGHKLYAAIAESVDILVTLTMAPATRRMAERLGAVSLAPFHQYSRWTRLDSDSIGRYLLHRTAHRPKWHGAMRAAVGVNLPSLAAGLLNPALALRDRARPLSPVPSVSFTEVERFDQTIDGLWERVSGDYDAAFVRDAKWLNWRFCDCPGLTYTRFVAHRNGAAVGYLVLRRAEPVELPHGIIADAFAARHDTETMRALLVHAVNWFGCGVASVECATSIAEHAGVVRVLGFMPTRILRPTVVCRDVETWRRIGTTANGWLFSKADHDWDQIILA